MKKPENYAVLRLIWSARGYVAKEVSSQLKRQWPNRDGLSVASVQRKAQYGAKAPPDIARFIKDTANFPVKAGYEEASEIARAGLAAKEAGPLEDPEALAARIAAKVPTLDPEAIAQAIASKRLRFPVRRLALRVADALRDKFDVMNAKLDKIEAQRERDKQEILRAVRAMGGLNSLVVLVSAVLLSGVLYNAHRVDGGSAEASRAPQVVARRPVLTLWQPLREEPAPLAEAESPGPSVHPSPAIDPDGEEDETQSLTGGLDGGTGIVRLVNQASPMPTHPLRKQHAAPCPEGIDEFNGYCWMKLSLTPAQIKAGACEEEGMYEPSPGWCREHNAGYRPYRGGRPGTSVDPQ